ncbi:MAG: hypothetical protein J5742_00015 [Alphaproteobacteria bacterium]|nr:hypothetical protein [Alphaproteobacteria bacterium]
MANVKDVNKGTQRVAFRAGDEALKAFDLRNALSASFDKFGMDLPIGVSKTNEQR